MKKLKAKVQKKHKEKPEPDPIWDVEESASKRVYENIINKEEKDKFESFLNEINKLAEKRGIKNYCLLVQHPKHGLSLFHNGAYRVIP